MYKTAAFWIRDGVLIDRMPVNAVAFAFASLSFADPRERTDANLTELINFAFQTSGISCLDKMRTFKMDRRELIADVWAASRDYDELATEAATQCRYFQGAIENLKDLHEYGVLNFITSAVDQDVLDKWAKSEQGKLIAPYVEEILGQRSADFGKGRAHFAYVREKYGVTNMILVADAVSEISMAAPLRTEFNLQTIGFAHAISKDRVLDAHKLVYATRLKLDFLDRTPPTAELELDESILSLPNERTLKEALARAQANQVISGHTDDIMSKLADALDRRVTVILKPGQKLPGGPNEKRIWKGRTTWVTQHGPSACLWHLGRPQYVTNALLPNGSRGTVENVWVARGWRRQSESRDRYVWGALDMTDADAVFKDVDVKPAMVTNSGPPNLEHDLHNSRMISGLVKNDQWAHTLNSLFHNRTFIHIESGTQWCCSMRSAGWIVAEMRNVGESYIKFYSRPSPYPRDREMERGVYAALHELGWDPYPRPGEWS